MCTQAMSAAKQKGQKRLIADAFALLCFIGIQLWKRKENCDMDILFVEYPKCSTCQKAKKWLDEHGIVYQDRHIKEQNPTAEELREWHERSGMDIKKFFNTSGVLYKELGLKEKLPEMSLEDKYKLLATDGMLVKRPVLVTEETVLTGFKPDEWDKVLANVK